MKIQVDKSELNQSLTKINNPISSISWNIFRLNETISNIIDSNTDPETGEISEAALLEIEKLEMNKLEKYESIALLFKNLKSFSDRIKEESKVLAERSKQYENKAERIKYFLDRQLNGQPLETERIKVSYRKSETVEIDDLIIELNGGYDKLPGELVKKEIVYKVDKMKVKEYSKNDLPLPNGITIQKNNNINIK